MRAIYDHQVFSLQNNGGITRVFEELVKYLGSQPEISTTVLIGYSNTEFDPGPSSRPIQIIHPGRSSLGPGIASYAVNEMASAVCAPFLGKFDIYHSTLYRFLPYVRTARYVATHHDCVPERFPELFPDRERIMRSKRRMFTRADRILCVSEASRQDLLHFYDVDPAKTLVIYNGVTAMRRTPGGADELRAHVSGDFLLYVGARHAYKNFEGLLRACAVSAAAEPYSLVAVGGGDPTTAEIEWMQKLGIENRVKFIPRASRALLAEAYASSTLLVYPSLYEGFGMPPLEAASLGCAALVASNPATREICGESVFYFDPADPSDFQKMLDFAIANREQRAAMAGRAGALLKTYTWENCGRKTLEAYLGLL